MTDEQRRALYRSLFRIRHIEERIAGLYAEQEMRCPVHLSIGQEAAAVGACAALKPTDYVMSGHRSHGHYLAKGGDLKRMMAEIYGKETGCSSGKGGSMHLVDLDAGFLGATPIVGSTIPIAVGTALAAQMKGEDRVAVSFLGDGATEEGVFHESVNFAVLKKLPVVFVCENNLYSVYSPLSVRQPEGRQIAAQVTGYGIESRQGDGNDVEEVCRLTENAVEKARSGAGPTFLEFSTYRWLEHCGPNYDNHIGYRTEDEFLEWRAKDPVENYRKRLTDSRVLSTAALDRITAECRVEMDQAVTFAKQSPWPDESQMLSGVYAEETA